MVLKSNNLDKQYLDLMQDIIDNGVYKNTRSGGVFSVFDRTMRFNLQDGFPLLTTKKVYTRAGIHELLWFLNGDTNIKYLNDNNVHIWDDDAYRWFKTLCKEYNQENLILPKEVFLEQVKKNYIVQFKLGNKKCIYRYGDLGPIYGKQWRSFGRTGRDQINDIISKLKNNPDDRRMILTAWNPDVLDEIALPACHMFAVFYTNELTYNERLTWLQEHSNGEYDEWKNPTHVTLDELNVPKRKLSCSFTMRSNDVPLGLPINIMSYALLTHLIAQCVNMEVGELVYHGVDVHIYENQIEGVKEQIKRNPHLYDLPKLKLNTDIKDIDKFKFEDITIENYNSYPVIKFPLSVG